MNEIVAAQLALDFKCELVIQSLLMAGACNLPLGSPPEFMADMQMAMLMGAEMA